VATKKRKRMILMADLRHGYAKTVSRNVVGFALNAARRQRR
jgi:hypothetical protein